MSLKAALSKLPLPPNDELQMKALPQQGLFVTIVYYALYLQLMRVALVKYNAGNIQSLTYALNRLGITPEVTADPERLHSADKVIFPGVGEASSAMRSLKANNLHAILPTLQQPFLGICLGQQLMCRHSEENDTPCLNIFDLEVRRFPVNAAEKVPHMGWNTITDYKSPLFEGLNDQAYIYFVHSYYVEVGGPTIATCHYAAPFSAAIHHNNFYAIQAHPEKSGKEGAQILDNFLKL